MHTLFGAGTLALVLAACTERRASPSDPGGSAAFTLRWRGSVAGASSDAFARIDAAHVSVAQGSAVLLDTVAPFSSSGDGQLALAVRLQDPTGTVTVGIDLLAGGQVLFRGGGSAELRRGGTASVAIAVAPVVAGVVAPASLTLTALGDTVRLRGAAVFASGDTVADAPVSWTGDGGVVIRVSPDGLVTALGEGEARATASYQGFSHVTAVTVQATVASVALPADTFSLYVDSTLTLVARVRDRNGNGLQRTIAWSSANPSVATVDAGGVVRAIGPGSARITATTQGQSASATVTVRRVPVGSVQVAPLRMDVVVSNTLQLRATVQDITGKVVTDRTITWSTDSAAVATVDSAGLVHALAVGRATISATSEGRSGSTLIQVVQPMVAVAVPQLDFRVRPGAGPSTQSVAVSNAGTGALSGLALGVTYSSQATGWLTASLSAPSAPALLTVTVDPGTLPVGTHTATVSVTSSVSGAGVAKVTVTLAVEQPRVGVSRGSVLLQRLVTSTGPVADTVSVRNVGTGTLTGVVASVAYAANEPAGWLTVTPSSWGVVTTGGATVTLLANGAGFAAGSYHATVTFSSSDPGVGAAQANVLLEVLTPTAPDVTYGVLHSTVRFWNTAIVSASAGTITGNSARVPPGATVRVRGSWQIGPVTDVSYCPTCIIEFYVAWIAPAPANGASPVNNGLWMQILSVLDPNPGLSGTFDFTTTAPTVPGQYYIAGGQTLDFVYQPGATGGFGWITGGPTTQTAASFRIEVR